jgi:7-keto-8-aminopelargonate synthetase-like enzyme
LVFFSTKTRGRFVTDNPNDEIAALRGRGLLRRLRALPECGARIRLADGRVVLNLSSNDYLGLADDPRVKAGAIEAVERLGCSARASRLMAGDLELCEQLEADLARLVGTEAALVFGSGFLANLGVMSAAAGRGDDVFADRLNHASLADGMRLSGARWHRYRHKDARHLASLLESAAAAWHGRPGHEPACRSGRSRGHPGRARVGRLVAATDSIFSMDGDRAPLDEIAEAAGRHGAMLIVDEAHAIGVMGAGGGGVCREAGCKVRPDFVVGTLSKSLGGYGGFVGCSAALRELLVNRARSFIYSTGLPPGCIGAARAALAVLSAQPQMGGQLLAKARLLRDLLAAGGLGVGAMESQILPVHVGGNDEAVRLSQLLWDRGVLAAAVRPPTVPPGTARLRLSVTLAHTDDELAAAAREIITAARQVGLV